MQVTDKRHYAVAVVPTPPEDAENAGTFATLDVGWVRLPHLMLAGCVCMFVHHAQHHIDAAG
jgi:hypothetical protein